MAKLSRTQVISARAEIATVRALDRAAKREGLSRSAFITRLLGRGNRGEIDRTIALLDRAIEAGKLPAKIAKALGLPSDAYVEEIDEAAGALIDRCRKPMGQIADEDLEALAALAKVLGLPEDSDADAVSAAVAEALQAVAEEEEPAPADPLGDSAQPAPPPAISLSKEALAYCKREGITHAEFLARKAKAVRRAGSGPREPQAAPDFDVQAAIEKLSRDQRAAARKAGFTLEQFVVAKRNAVRRHGSK